MTELKDILLDEILTKKIDRMKEIREMVNNDIPKVEALWMQFKEDPNQHMYIVPNVKEGLLEIKLNTTEYKFLNPSLFTNLITEAIVSAKKVNIALVNELKTLSSEVQAITSVLNTEEGTPKL